MNYCHFTHMLLAQLNSIITSVTLRRFLRNSNNAIRKLIVTRIIDAKTINRRMDIHQDSGNAKFSYTEPLENCPQVYRGRKGVKEEVVTKWEAIQDDLRSRIVRHDTEDWQRNPELRDLNYIGGLDISYPVDSPTSIADCDGSADAEAQNEEQRSQNNVAYSALVVLKYPSLSMIYSNVEQINFSVPYLPGFLSFREAQPLIDQVQKLVRNHPEWTPNVLLVDGNGILHQQEAGLASHVGFHTNLPCIGVSKNLYQMSGVECTKKMGQGMSQIGDCLYLRNGNNDVLGMALKTSKEAKNPVYVSIGHKISLETSKNVVLACCKYRVPEPIRMADFLSRETIRKS